MSDVISLLAVRAVTSRSLKVLGNFSSTKPMKAPVNHCGTRNFDMRYFDISYKYESVNI